MTQPKNTSHDKQQKTEQAREEARKVGQNVTAQASEVKDQATQATQQVAGQARAEAEQVVTEARDQVRGLIDTTLGEVRSRAAEGQSALASTVRSFSQELQQMTGESSASGPVAQLAGDLAGRGDKLASWLGDKEPDDVLLEVPPLRRPQAHHLPRRRRRCRPAGGASRPRPAGPRTGPGAGAAAGCPPPCRDP